MFTKKISLIMPCYWPNQQLFEMTENCLDSLYFNGWNDIDEVLVIDDGSPEQLVPAYGTLLKRETNGGYAKAVNTGLYKASGDYIIICNNDIEFIQPDWLQHLIQPLEEGYGISSIRTTDSNGWSTEDRYEANAKFGSLWAMTRETYDKLGDLDDSFGKGYYEDLDYWHRAQDNKIKITKNHAGLVEHKGAATFNMFGDELVNMHYEAMIKYAEKYKRTSYLVPKDGGVTLFDKYDCIDLNWYERKKMSEISISVSELKKLLKARRQKEENDKRAKEIWEAVKNV